jgi:hypothetical protein
MSSGTLELGGEVSRTEEPRATIKPMSANLRRAIPGARVLHTRSTESR